MSCVISILVVEVRMVISILDLRVLHSRPISENDQRSYNFLVAIIDDPYLATKHLPLLVIGENITISYTMDVA